MLVKVLVLVAVLLVGPCLVWGADDEEQTTIAGEGPVVSDDGSANSVVHGQVITGGGGMNFPDEEVVQPPGQAHSAAEGDIQGQELDNLANDEPAFDNDTDVDNGTSGSGRRRRYIDFAAEVGPSRVKRLALKDPREYWPEGIVPFKFGDGMSDVDKEHVRAAQMHIEKYTCIKFVDYDNGNAEKKHNLGHPGHLIYKPGSSCSSIIGLWRRRNGQDVICCNTNICIHENVHAFGLLHEQSSDAADNWIRINFENIYQNKWANFIKMHPDVAEGSTYDYSSMMHYGTYDFSKNYRPVFTMLCGSPTFQFGGHTFYMFRQLTKKYFCDTKGACDGKSVKCENQGYPSSVRGECSCICPEGLDPKSGCAKIIGNAPRSSFPKGSYGFLKPKVGCPPGFTEGKATLESAGGNKVSGNSHLNGEFSDTVHTFGFCLKEDSSGEVEWEPGNYCVLKKGDCPSGFLEGTVSLTGKASGANTKSGSLPDGAFGDKTDLEICCRRDGANFDPVWFPNTHPFYLFQIAEKCQNIDGMMVTAETFTFVNRDEGSPGLKGKTPDVNVKKKTFKFYLCYYTPQDRSCGKVLELSEASPTVEITSPGYPDPYKPGLECNWLIKAPALSHVVFDFADFDIPLVGGQCSDHVEIRKDYIGQPGLWYCGEGFPASIRTWTNEAMIVFRSDGDDDGGKGFKAKITLKMKKDMCYNEADRGNTYRGNRNVTNDFRPCLPWSQVTHCRHHAFQTGDFDDGLDGNFCRNPGHGVEPWCYTVSDGCLRSCCDSCFDGKIHDNLGDCAALKASDPSFCKTLYAYEYCTKTCEQELGVPEPPPKGSTVTCSAPASISDSDLKSETKSTYHLGDFVEYQCKTGHEKVKSFCLSNGKWSAVGYTCGGCSSGYHRMGGNCFKFQDIRTTYAEAEKVCEAEQGVIASAATQEEQDFVATLERPMNPMWIGLVKSGSAWKWKDGSEFSYTNWYKGNPSSSTHTVMLGGNNNYQWKNVPPSNKYTFTCKVKPSERKLCVDREENCALKIAERPGLCNEYKNFAESHCAKTCGICETISATCTVPASLSNGKFLTTGTVQFGDVVEFTCDYNYMTSGGSGLRACTGSGKLNDPVPECVDITSTTGRNNDIEIIRRKKIPGTYRTFIGNSTDATIRRSGKVIAWEFYSTRVGQVALQVFRLEDAAKNTFKFIGQTALKTQLNKHEYIALPEAEQISVQAGDVIGVWYAYVFGGVCYDKCEGSYDGYKMKKVHYYKSNFKADQVKEFLPDSICRRFSLSAIIAPE